VIGDDFALTGRPKAEFALGGVRQVKIPPQIWDFALIFVDQISKTVYHSCKFADATL
jgi:hypothetical protein